MKTEWEDKYCAQFNVFHDQMILIIPSLWNVAVVIKKKYFLLLSDLACNERGTENKRLKCTDNLKREHMRVLYFLRIQNKSE